MGSSSIAVPQDILDAWFGGHAPDEPATGKHQAALWWGANEATDRALQERWGPTHEAAARGQLDAWAQTSYGRIALVLVLDQLSRNLYRGTPRAFAQDQAARALVDESMVRGDDRSYPLFQRIFFYMPLEHSESLADQERCCRSFEILRDDNEGAYCDVARTFLGFARRHRDIIARFGRFPHRNAILGRPSSVEEQRFLEQPGSSF